MIEHDGHTFAQEDALSLSRWWQDYAFNPKKTGSIAGDNVDSLLDELCYALGCTTEEIRATWWSERQKAKRQEARVTLDEAKAETKRNQDRAPYLSDWKHLKSGGLYVVRMHVLIEATLEPTVIYYKRHADPLETWCRPASEFFDGRFERVSNSYTR